MLKSDFHVAEMIRREDAAALRRRKKKAITVEIDPETYIAKEILYQQAVLYAIRQKIAGCAEDDSEQLIEYQHAFSGGVSLLDLSPNDFNILMQLVRGKPTKAELQAAYQKLTELFGPLDLGAKEVLGNGV